MSEFSGRVRGVVNTPTKLSASGRWSVRAVAKYVADNVWPRVPLPGGDFEPLAVVSIPSGGSSSIVFGSIPQTYQHLQIRGILNGANCLVRFNGDSTTTYRRHYIGGTGSSIVAGSDTTTGLDFLGGSGTANVFNVSVIDILDYANTSKNTTARMFRGVDLNGSGDVWMMSGLWPVTNAITSISIVGNGGNLNQHSTYALYGVNANA